MPSPKTDLAASLTRIPDVGAGAFALWWLSAYAGIDGAKHHANGTVLVQSPAEVVAAQAYY